jgi:peptidoglycan-associated lipoprotein
MMNRVTTFTVVFCLFLALTITGCAKKPAEQTKEVAPAQTQQGTQVSPPSEQSKGEVAPPTPAVEPVAFDKKIYFDFDMYTLTPESTAALNELIAFMKSNVNLKVKIEGNCDERGTTEYNVALGERRAKAAQDYIISQGIDPAKVSAISYGKEKPADPGHDEAAWAKNRRDEFVFSK